MNQSKTGGGTSWNAARQFILVLLCLLTILGFLFWNGIKPGHVVFSNDGPLGAMSAHCGDLPGVFLGFWNDMNWLGLPGPSATPDVSQFVHTLSGHVIFAKIYAPFALLFLGLSAWLCFRQWKFTPAACLIGAVATSLNSDFFSTACWGVAGQPLSFGCDFLALAALADMTSPKRWVRVILAGFAVGVGVMEAFDIGAIFSLVIAAFVVYQGLVSEGTTAQKVTRAFTRLAIVGGFALFIAAAAVSTLIATQIKGVAGMEQDVESKSKRWDEATMWSMPKAETLSMIVPGLFGFRMDTPDGGSYWGKCGRHPAWDRFFASDRKGPPPDPQSYFIRYGGGGVYTGVVVVLIALWAAFQSFRKENSVFSLLERKYIWFWTGIAVLCALVGLGRFAPFYQFFYALPFASTMRNPSKFYHVVEWMMVILFAYGVHGLTSRSIADAKDEDDGLLDYFRKWWSKAVSFDKKWIIGMVVALGVSLIGWLIYASSRDKLVEYLTYIGGLEGRRGEDGAAMALATASFSIRQVGWYILFLALGTILVAIFISGYFRGWKARLGAILLGLLVLADLGIANRFWVISWNWVDKYASNPVIDLLRQKPYEQRVAILPFPPPAPQFGMFNGLYGSEWKQQLFPYNNIQTLDIVMMPRAPKDYIGFETAMSGDGTAAGIYKIRRRWELTNTRYLLGPAMFLDALNKQIDPEKQRFKYLTRFDLRLKQGLTQITSYEDITADITPEGQFAVFDFTGALPRAKLYANWQVNTNDQQTLAELSSPGFDPQKAVLVANQLSPPTPSGATNENPGSVEFVSYAPKQIVLKAQAAVPSVLLLNDKFDPNWHVSVDGKPETLLRCNYLMRGVLLPAGTHTVEFRFQPPIDTLYVSIAAVVIALGLVGYLFVTREKSAPTASEPYGSSSKPSGKGKK